MRKRIKIIFGVVLANLWACQAFNQVTGIIFIGGKYKIDTATILANKNLQPLINDLNKSDIIEKKRVAEIPGFIKTFLDSLTGNFSIANRGEKWQTSDVNVDDNLPVRQLIYFGLGNDIALFTYYTNDFGMADEHIIIIKFKGNNIVDFWCIYSELILKELKSKKETVNFLIENMNKHREQYTNYRIEI